MREANVQRGAAHTIRLQGSDEGFRCIAGDTVLASALRSGVAFPYECNSGGCGSCQFELVEGDVDDAWPQAPGISDRQRGRGRRLACQTVPTGDCTIKVRLSADAVPVCPAILTAIFEDVRQLTPDMSEFTFRSQGAARFLPGQFAMLRLPGVDGARAYSMSNLANEERLWRFIIKRVPGGQGTEALFDGLAAGTAIEIDGPFGNSYLRTDTERPIVCIAGGSGLSPVMSILRGLGADSRFDGRRVMFFYGGRGPTDMCVAEMLGAEPALRDRVELHLAISDDEASGAAEWAGHRGFIHDLVRESLGEGFAQYEYYFCGPPPMTDAVHRMLMLEAKVPASQLHFDRFY
ncbi:2Fe-2S iron-sulfur cluster-binding protein [Novosphingobium malaysiense]|uniref:Oxidoreductase n=1 Tax=Novosphingobium malaysiense TaxID=1348853 RepID=A0A0B1ZUV1_9SPHN|nr:2Fe-2S iron-sulfur cluster-binding protein [Novosphingobium malaysiense]KHK92943.1 hypothetical protein LK12_00690 [Novosphingobium malaysiense]